MSSSANQSGSASGLTAALAAAADTVFLGAAAAAFGSALAFAGAFALGSAAASALSALGAAAAFALVALFAQIATALVASRRCRVPRLSVTAFDQCPPVTIIRPVCGVDTTDEATLRSTFELTHPEFEVLFCCAKADDPAVQQAQDDLSKAGTPDAMFWLGHLQEATGQVDKARATYTKGILYRV